MKEQTRKFKVALSALAATLVLCVAGFLIAGISQLEVFKGLGPWGDFFGGTLNPILGSATVLALLYTIYLQRQANDLQKEELALTREELSRSADALENQIRTLDKQNFEATFFNMLNIHNDILNNIDVHIDQRVIHGRDCFTSFFERLVYTYRKRLSKDYIQQTRTRPSAESIISDYFKALSSEVGHYYRHLYTYTSFIDGAAPNKLLYMKIVRAQLSNHELALLFYNCLSGHGEDMKPLVEKYALLKHMPDDLFLDPSHKGLIAPSAFGETAA